MTTRSVALPAALLALPPEVLAALVELLPDPAAEMELRRQLCHEAARDAFRRGYQVGYERGARVRETEWPEIVKPLGEPTLAELELLRWGPGGRERFGEPRPGDRYPQTRLEAAS